MLIEITFIVWPTDQRTTLQFTYGASKKHVKHAACQALGLDVDKVQLVYDDTDIEWTSTCYKQFMDLVCYNELRCGEQLLHYVQLNYTYQTCLEHLEWYSSHLDHMFQPLTWPTPWILAAKRGRLDLIELFAAWYPAGINIMDRGGDTPLYISIWTHDYNDKWGVEITGALISLGADVNANGGSALSLALNIGNYGAVVQLVDVGTSIFCRRLDGMSMFELAKGKCSEHLSMCLRRRDVVVELWGNHASYLGLLTMDIWRHYIDRYLYNAPVADHYLAKFRVT